MLASAMMPRFALRCVSAALLAGFAFIEFARPVCIAQDAIELPGGENFKEMHITDGERFTFFQEGKPKSLEENVELKLIAASDEDKNVTVKADKIEFFYAEDTGKLARIAATGKVSFFVEPSRKEMLEPGDPQDAMELHGDTVTWITSKNTVELQGNPRAEGEGWALTGESIVYDIEEFLPNQFVLLKDAASEKHTALARVRKEQGRLVALSKSSEHVWNISPRNMQQRMALELLLDDKVSLVTLVGMAGTGKTLLALAAGLQRVVHEKAFDQMLVGRPIMPLGKDIGYLPGTKEEKLTSWMEPIFDNLRFLLAGRGKSTDHSIDSLIEGNPQHVAMVRQLEEVYDAESEQRMGDLPSGDDLAEELQRFLREQGD